MDETTKLSVLKANLQKYSTSDDTLLKNLLKQAESLVKRRGIIDDASYDYEMAIVDYAAFLFRRRSAPDMAMPTHLKVELNNILFSQKSKTS